MLSPSVHLSVVFLVFFALFLQLIQDLKGYEHLELLSKIFEVVTHEAYVAITKRLRYSLIKIAVDLLTQTEGTPRSQCVTGSIRSTDHHSLLDSFYSIFMGLIMVYLHNKFVII